MRRGTYLVLGSETRLEAKTAFLRGWNNTVAAVEGGGGRRILDSSGEFAPVQTTYSASPGKGRSENDEHEITESYERLLQRSPLTAMAAPQAFTPTTSSTSITMPITVAASTTPQHQPLVGDSTRAFLAGACSGFAKCTVGHPFDTIKVRLQTAPQGKFTGPLDCLLTTVRREGPLAVYKGMTPPLVGWLAMDSVMLGSLNLYKRMLRDNIPQNALFHRPTVAGPATNTGGNKPYALASFGHGVAGTMAGCTVCVVATPVEHLKARLQVQYAANKSERLYKGPVDCLKKIYTAHGVRGLYHGFPATLVFRSFFFFWWSSYDLFSRYLQKHSSLSTPAINFWAGGASAQIFWLFSYPSDVVKQRVMTDPLGGKLGDGARRFPRWRDAAKAVYSESGWRGYWRGFVPCFLRAFPANACALLAFESVMRGLA